MARIIQIAKDYPELSTVVYGKGNLTNSKITNACFLHVKQWIIAKKGPAVTIQREGEDYSWEKYKQHYDVSTNRPKKKLKRRSGVAAPAG